MCEYVLCGCVCDSGGRDVVVIVVHFSILNLYFCISWEISLIACFVVLFMKFDA